MNVIAFLKTNKGTILYGLGTLGLMLLGDKLGVRADAITPGFFYNQPRPLTIPIANMDSNPTRQAINSIAKSALKSVSSSSKLSAANHIMSILSNGAGDETRAYAIMALEKISESSVSNSVKDSISEMITKIGAGEAVSG